MNTGQREQRARLPDVVERDVGERDVLLDHRRVAAPLGQPLAVHEAGVAEAQHVFGGGIHHILSTSDGSS